MKHSPGRKERRRLERESEKVVISYDCLKTGFFSNDEKQAFNQKHRHHFVLPYWLDVKIGNKKLKDAKATDDFINSNIKVFNIWLSRFNFKLKFEKQFIIQEI